ncbi:hypothetical protein BP5796_08188 [Coleophoma crateriformis]|uniref:Glucose-methanol-choline oxidoreductase N-terminal domain-containing protein n=1 Tax=Coleophoma crateriformis TaxID=565419 RepID=A0A3D8RE65_9HELO|nr:hypothetical protein BP5796_08188 [Coleophoma crateriformis]
MLLLFYLLSMVSFLPVTNARIPFYGETIRNQSQVLDIYDFVVVGGGTSGLVVANRLSEDPNTTVLVIEAGGFDEHEDFVAIPLLTSANIPVLGNGPRGTKYDWNLTGVPQPELGGRSVQTPAGKVVGGGSVLNGMVYNRGSRAEYDRWEELGNPGWNFDGLLPYFKKAENFTPPSEALLAEWDIEYNPAFHGSQGFVHSSFPPFVWPSSRNFLRAMLELGIRVLKDSMGGDSAGAYWFALSLNPRDESRSTAREYYIPERPNLHLLTQAQVTKLNIEAHQSKHLVTGVAYVKNGSSTRQSVNARNEVILAAGTLHTPQILQLSGIGDATHLSSIGVEPLVDLPGVGANYQDHLLYVIVQSVNIAISTGNFSNATWNAEQRALYDTERQGPYTTTSGNFLASLPLNTFARNGSSKAIQSTAAAQLPTRYLPTNIDGSVVNGYLLQHKLLVRDLSSNVSAHLEFILSDSVILPVLLQPFSRGTIRINSTSPFDPPQIDPRYFSNPLDLSTLIMGIEFGRALQATHALQELNAQELFPGASVQSTSELGDSIRDGAQSTHHHVGTASMLPKHLGGVVDPKLRVYDIHGLRIVDASVIPMLPACHMQSTVYAVAEKVGLSFPRL